MALTIEELPRDKGGRLKEEMVSTTRIYVNADQSKQVPMDSREAAFMLYGKAADDWLAAHGEPAPEVVPEAGESGGGEGAAVADEVDEKQADHPADDKALGPAKDKAVKKPSKTKGR